MTSSTSALVSAIPSAIACCVGDEKLPRSNVLPGPRPSLAKRSIKPVSDGSNGAELQQKVQVGEDRRGLEHVWRRFRPVNGRGRLWRGFMQKTAQWLGVIASLYLSDINDVGRIEKLRANEQVNE